MTLKTGSLIGNYRLLRDFAGGANCRWSFADKGGKEYFVKEFQRPKYPPDALPAEVRREKLRRCTAFEHRHKQLVTAMGRVCAPGGNIVMPVDFFRLGLVYYHIAPRIDTTTLTLPEIAALADQEKLLLLRLLSRSLTTLHSQKIVHGDLKPTNILIHRSAAGILSPKLIDFDGSFFEGEPPDQDDMSFDQAYMAPEILAYNKEASARKVKPASLGTAADIFSFAILLHEYWTGRRPVLGGEHLYTADAVRDRAPIRIEAPGLDDSLVQLCRDALVADPAARPRIEQFDTAIGAVITASRAPPRSAAKPVPAAAETAETSPPPAVTIRFSKNFGRAATVPGFAEPPPPPLAPASAPAPAAEAPSGIVIRKSKNLKDRDH